ncbi:uncharacterized protein LOC131949669 [Physella acuta]|uniref:uncharacterized protein LOC131949669 n=1 Tax=Physella acuta TaxID=109671 RepID=UPI0027DB78C2|nr:uncharacterized protein LOC131949669 [Physella acuta]
MTSNTTSTNSTTEPYFIVFVSDRVYTLIQYIIFYCIWPVVILAGILSNTLNIVVFVKIGVKDSMMASFLALSTTDLAYLLCASLPASATIIGLSGTMSSMPINAFFLAGVAVQYQALFLDISLGIIAYVSVAKCCCVVIALKFKSVFTLKRTFVVLVLIILAALATRLPVFTSMGLSWVWNSQTNKSQLVGWFTKDFKPSIDFVNALNKTAYPNVIFVIVLICSIILSSSLVEASAVRMKMTSGGNKINAFSTKQQSGHDGGFENHEEKFSTTLSKRDIHVIRQVVTVAITLMITVLILSVISLADVFVPDFYSTGRYRQLFNIIETIGYTCTHLHAGVHLAIYLRFNSQFRTTCRQMFGIET